VRTSRLALIMDALRGSFWFLPALLTLAAATLAVGLLVADARLPSATVRSVGWIYTGGAEGARSLLATVAGTVVTVVGVAFSVTIVSLQLAAAQLGPRVLRNFMRDRGNQAVLGTFVATFVYCLLVLRSVRGGNGLTEDAFVPHLAVTGGVALAVLSAGVLIYFIHHAAVSMQADHVIATIALELDQAIDRLYPERLGEDVLAAGPPPVVPGDFEATAVVVTAPASGYVQSIDGATLMARARERDLLVRLDRRPGDFVVTGEPLARAWPRERLHDADGARLATTLTIGPVRTLVQDVLFGVEQLVEIAVRALSSDLRDPTTAMRCIDRLGAAVARLADRRMPSPYRRDGARLRVIAPGVSLAEVVHVAFDAIRARGAASAAVSVRLLETFERLARLRPGRELHVALLRETAETERGSRGALTSAWERRTVEQHAVRVRSALHAEVLAEERIVLSRPA
jgi:uncharacterized membrane protein